MLPKRPPVALKSSACTCITCMCTDTAVPWQPQQPTCSHKTSWSAPCSTLTTPGSANSPASAGPMSALSANTSTSQSAVLVEICIRHVKPWKDLSAGRRAMWLDQAAAFRHMHVLRLNMLLDLYCAHMSGVRDVPSSPLLYATALFLMY